MANSFSRQEYVGAVEELDKLCRREYQIGLVKLLENSNEDLTLERLRRLTGILLKQPFAKSRQVRPEDTKTGASYAWHWETDRIEDPKSWATSQYALLSQLIPGLDPNSPPPQVLAELHERGLYKYLALWLNDKLKGNTTKGFRDYLAQHESPEFDSILNIADWASQAVIGGVLAPMVGIPTVVVSLGLIGGKYGYRKLVEAAEAEDV